MEQLDLFPRREYMISLKNDPGNYYHDYVPDEIPDHVVDLICRQNVDKKLQLCGKCETNGIICHVLILDPETTYTEAYKKYCPILFQDLIKPPWTVEDVVK